MRWQLRLEIVAVQADLKAHRHRGPQRLRGVTAPLGVGNQLPHPPGWGGAADLQQHRDLLERPTRALQAELVSRAEAAPDL